MLTDAERNALNIGLQKYPPGQSEPILIGGEKLLKPALQLISYYRLRIDETSYTRWLASVETIGSENQEVYVAFSPNFERIWLESKKRLPECVSQKPANLRLRSQYAISPNVISDYSADLRDGPDSGKRWRNTEYRIDRGLLPLEQTLDKAKKFTHPRGS